MDKNEQKTLASIQAKQQQKSRLAGKFVENGCCYIEECVKCFLDAFMFTEQKDHEYLKEIIRALGIIVTNTRNTFSTSIRDYQYAERATDNLSDVILRDDNSD